MGYEEMKRLMDLLESVSWSLRKYDIVPHVKTKEELTNNMCVTFYDPGPSLKPYEICPAIEKIAEELRVEVKNSRIEMARKILREEGVDGYGDDDE